MSPGHVEVIDKPTTAYTRLGELATGGMGTVDVVVRQEGSFSRLYAMKRLLPHLRVDEQVRAMFLDEARYAGLIRHANVVSVLDVGEDADGPYLVMDYVDGVALSDILKLREPLPLQICLRIALQTADGLHAAHELKDTDGERLNLVHRDVSPQNVLVGFDGVVRVTDFGIAKALGQSSRTSTGLLKGKFGYMAPERLRFDEPDLRSDLFSLGVVLYELLSGERLYHDGGGRDAAKRILNEPPPDITDVRPDTPAAMVELLFELLAKNPEHRPASAKEVSRRIGAVLAEVVALEEPLELADYVEERFAEGRHQRKAELSAQLQQLSTSPAQASPSTLATIVIGPDTGDTAVSEPSAPSPGRWRRLALTAVLAAVGVGGGVYVIGVAGPDGQPPAESSASGLVSIVVETEPPGASLQVSGTAWGVTPTKLSLPRGDTPVPLHFSMGGYRDHEASIVPEIDQRLRFDLTRVEPAASASATAAPSPRRELAAPRPRPRPVPPPRSTSASPKPSTARDPRDFERFE